MCELCENIINLSELQKINHWDRPDICLTKNSSGSIDLWVEQDDWYYSGIVTYVRYCPHCGRNLYG